MLCFLAPLVPRAEHASRSRELNTTPVQLAFLHQMPRARHHALSARQGSHLVNLLEGASFINIARSSLATVTKLRLNSDFKGWALGTCKHLACIPAVLIGKEADSGRTPLKTTGYSPCTLAQQLPSPFLKQACSTSSSLLQPTWFFSAPAPSPRSAHTCAAWSCLQRVCLIG